MSDWIKDNKFAAGMLAVALVAIIGTFFFSGSKSDAFDAAKAEYDQQSSNYNSLIRTEPFPSPENQQAYRKSVVAYRGQVEALQKSLLAFRPEKFEKIRPADFTTRIVEVGNTIKAGYDKAGIKYPDKWQLGFETYTTSPPRDSATDFLNYELDALSWLYQTLAKSGPSELLNVYRERLPVEDGKAMGGGGGNQNNSRRNRGQQAGPGEPYFTLPLELTFRGRESALREFLSQLAGSKNYFFVVRSMRVQNVKSENPPKKSDANFKQAAAPAAGDKDPFAGFEFVIPGEEGTTDGDEEEGGETEGEEEATEEATEEAADEEPIVPAAPDAGSGEQILGQVLGAEELNVFLQLELILFRGNVKLPEVK